MIRPRRGASPSTESSELTREGHGLSPTPPRTWSANEVRSRRSGDGKQDDDPGYILTPKERRPSDGSPTGRGITRLNEVRSPKERRLPYAIVSPTSGGPQRSPLPKGAETALIRPADGAVLMGLNEVRSPKERRRPRGLL